MIRRPPRSTRTDTLFPYTTLFRSRGKTSRDLQTPVDRDDLTRHPSELRTGERCEPLADIGRHAAAPERDSPALVFLYGLDHIVRPDESSVGKECVSKCRSRWSLEH